LEALSQTPLTLYIHSSSWTTSLWSTNYWSIKNTYVIIQSYFLLPTHMQLFIQIKMCAS